MINKIFLVLAIIGLGIGSCSKKGVNIDNSNSIKVPYSLFVSGQGNEILHSNDGITYNRLKGTSGSFTNSILVVDSNVLFFNRSVNCGSGMNFPYYPYLAEPNFKILVKNGLIIDQGYPNISLYDASNKRVYACGESDFKENDSSGKCMSGDWRSIIMPTATTVTSVTRTENGDVYAYDIGQNTYKRTAGQGAFTLMANAGFPANGQFMFISHHNNMLTLSDVTGNFGVQYSTNGGLSWAPFANPFPNKSVLFAKPVEYNNEYVTSFDSIGLCKLVGTTLVPFGGGLPQYIRAYDIVGKRNVYKTGISKYYYYLATDQGLYLSEDNMQNWVKVRDGVHTAVK